MIKIKSSDDFVRAVAGMLEPAVRRLLLLRSEQLLGDDDTELGDLAHFIVVQRGDMLADVEAEIGFRLSAGRDHDPPFEWVERHHGGILEAVAILNDDGFAVTLIVSDRIDTDPKLLVPLLALT